MHLRHGIRDLSLLCMHGHPQLGGLASRLRLIVTRVGS
jgi:hypothetical protein